MGLPFLPRLDHGEEVADRLGVDLSCPSPAASLLPEVSREDESPTASLAPRLACAAALAGAGYWITLRDFKGRTPGWGVPRSDRADGPASADGRSCRGGVLGQIGSVFSVGKVIRFRQVQRATSLSLNGGLFASGNSA